MKLVLVHGIFDNGGLFRHLLGRLSRHGHDCYAPSLKPADARHGIADLAGKLRGLIDARWGPEAPIGLIGFSMGCLIARYYLQELDGQRRGRVLFAISGPHRGSLSAWCYVGRGAREMRPGSAFLRGLEASEHRLAGMPLYSYHTPFDLMILPPASSRWPRAVHLSARAPLHSLMVRDPAVCSDIEARLAQLERRERAAEAARITPDEAPTDHE